MPKLKDMDPTRTVTLRRAALQAVRRKFARLKGLLIKLVMGEDAFGLKRRVGNSLVTNPFVSEAQRRACYAKDDPDWDCSEWGRYTPKKKLVKNAGRFQFHSSPDKVKAFQDWLRQQFKATLLGKSDEELWAEFAKRGYEKGMGRAFEDVNKKRRWLPGEGEFYGRSKQEFLRSSFGRRESADKLKLLAGRSFADLKNVTEDMATRMSRTLMDGLARGANPRELVDSLVEDLEVSEVRAEAIARTEIIRAHAEGQLDAMEKLGVEEVGVAVEWDTAKDGRVCRHCQPLQGVVLTTQEAHGLIPAHVNCRCAFVPANVGEDDSDQIRSKKAILKAFEEAEVDPPELDDERPRPLVEPTKNSEIEMLLNSFCATGPGGGVDPSCSPKGHMGEDTTLTGYRKYKLKIGDETVGDVTVIDKGDGVVRTEKLGVERAHRGKGYAVEMYRQLFTHLKSEGVKTVISGLHKVPGGRAVWESLSRSSPISKQSDESYRLDLSKLP